MSYLMATPKKLLIVFLISFYVTAYGQPKPTFNTKTTLNKIDSLTTDKEAFTFVRQHFHKYEGDESFDNYRNETRQIADSFKVRNWVKADIDNNGETDLLIFRADQLPKVFAILSYGGKFGLTSAKYSNCKYQFIYPVVATLNNQEVILLYSQGQIDYDANIKHFIYTKLVCDTLIVRDNLFVNYVQSPRVSEIEKIEIYNDGMCEGNCPRINISINAKTLTSKCSKEIYWENKPKSLTAQLIQNRYQDVIIGNCL